VGQGGLSAYEGRIHSQNGEDGVIAEILERIGRHPAPSFVEFGAETGAQGNCALLAEAGWDGVFWELDPPRAGVLARRQAGNPKVRTGCEKVTAQNIDQLLERYGAARELDVLSIDIDGDDYWVWQALRARSPRLVVIEYNALLGAQARLVQPQGQVWTGSDYFGASAAALQALGSRKGYELVYTEMAGVNAFFVRRDLDWRSCVGERLLVRPVNYSLCGLHHPPDSSGRTYLEV
jgi:hypothetical protein